MGDGIVQHGPAAHRLADKTHVGKFQVIDQGAEVAGIVGGIGAAGDGVGRREAAMGEGHASVSRREVCDLLPPAEMIAAQPMGEQQRRPVAGDFVVQVAERPFQFAGGALHAVLFRRGSA